MWAKEDSLIILFSLHRNIFIKLRNFEAIMYYIGSFFELIKSGFFFILNR